MTKRYVKLKCSVCDRTRDTLINLTHYNTDKCTITLGCEGRLFPIGTTADGTALTSIPPAGLQNWHPRGLSSAVTSLGDDLLYNTSTGAFHQLIIAVQDSSIGFIPNSTSTLMLNLIAEQQQARDYRQYTYRLSSSCTVVNGVESSVTKKVLRYTIVGPNPDQLEIFVDGVKRALGTGPLDFQLYDGTVGSPVPPNSVLFNTPIVGVAIQVDVIVTKAATLSTVQLPFARMIDDDSRIGTGAWEGINAVKKLDSRWSLFYCDLDKINITQVGVKLRLDPAVGVTILQGTTIAIVPPVAASFLLSRTKLYTAIDRLRGSWVPLQTLNSDTNYLVVNYNDNAKQLLVTQSSISGVFPALDVTRYNTSALLRTGLSGNITGGEIDGCITIGPDA